jgi:hypothetical protein
MLSSKSKRGAGIGSESERHITPPSRALRERGGLCLQESTHA